MTVGDAIMRSILEEPHEDVHRLVYADWLEESGDAGQARNIRLQVADPSRGLPIDRTAGVLAHGLERVLWHRGFVAEISLPLAAFLAHAGAIFRAHPIARVTLSDRTTGLWLAPSLGWRATTDGLTVAFAIPPDLFSRLSGERKLGGLWKTYPGEADAHADLSRACVSLGRELAGLPPLPPAP